MMSRNRVVRRVRQNVTDLVLSALRLLREDIREVVDSMEPVEPWDEG